MNDIIAEASEALKQERLEKLWKDYGGYVIALVLAVILGTGAVSGYKAWNESVETKQTAMLLDALEADNVADALEQAGENTRPPLRGIALIRAAGVLLDEEKPDEALALFEKVSVDSSIPADFRDIATLMSVRLGSAKENAAKDGSRFQSMLKRVWSNDKSPWRHHARVEAAVLLAHFDGDYAGAQAHLDTVLAAKNVPASLTQKATALKHVYSLRAAEHTKPKSEG